MKSLNRIYTFKFWGTEVRVLAPTECIASHKLADALRHEKEIGGGTEGQLWRRVKAKGLLR